MNQHVPNAVITVMGSSIIARVLETRIASHISHGATLLLLCSAGACVARNFRVFVTEVGKIC